MSAPTTPPAEPAQHHPSLGRKTSSGKKVLKEKVVLIYDAFFKGEDPSLGNANFWDEFFLLRANTAYMEKEFDSFDGEQLASLKDTINTIFYKCVQVLKTDPSIRTVNAMQTLIAVIRSIFRKSLPSGNCGFDVIEILMGFDSAECQMETLVTCLHNFLTQDVPASLKSLCLKLLLVLVTATDNVSQNTILEYVMINSIFEAIIQLLASPTGRQSHGHDAILVLTILVQYRKYESVNPYIVKLSILDDELALNGSAQVVSGALTEFNRQYNSKKQEATSGIFSALTNMVGSMFVGDETVQEAVKANDSILLALYEALHLNRNFITTLTHGRWPKEIDESHTPSTPATPPSTPTATKPTTPDSPGVQGLDFSSVLEPTSQPTNLLVTLLEYTSIVMRDTKDETRYNNCKLCLIILACIAEDQYANSLMHDVNMNFRVTLHRMPMRHRKAKIDKRPPSRPLACALLDLMVEFIMSHMMKALPMELYMKCLGITQRILCYQKKCRVRLQYTWKELWTALMNLLKFLMSNEATIMKKHSIFPLAMQIVNIFNLFITYGDTFLPTPASYDELYYELIRMHQVYDNLYSMALRYSTTDCESKESASRLANCLTNIRAIINHFTPKVDAFSSQHQLSSLTEEQVLEVVRTNYDTLTLKLQESLDIYERYSEKPKESAFFKTLVRSIILDVRKNIDVAAIEHQTMIRDFAMIPVT